MLDHSLDSAPYAAALQTLAARMPAFFEPSEGFVASTSAANIGCQTYPSRMAVVRAAYSNPATIQHRNVSRDREVLLAAAA